jgi:hypothetical protein
VGVFYCTEFALCVHHWPTRLVGCPNCGEAEKPPSHALCSIRPTPVCWLQAARLAHATQLVRLPYTACMLIQVCINLTPDLPCLQASPESPTFGQVLSVTSSPYAGTQPHHCNTDNSGKVSGSSVTCMCSLVTARCAVSTCCSKSNACMLTWCLSRLFTVCEWQSSSLSGS